MVINSLVVGILKRGWIFHDVVDLFTHLFALLENANGARF